LQLFYFYPSFGENAAGKSVGLKGLKALQPKK